MSRMRLSLIRKVFSASAVIYLLCAPMPLAATAASFTSGASTVEWFSSIWADLAAWLARETTPPPPAPELPSESQTDNGCAVDPHGGCGG